MTFEAAFQKLEKVVEQMEAGGLSLEQATALYEEGLKLAQLCSQKLDVAELKISKLESAFKERLESPEENEGNGRPE